MAKFAVIENENILNIIEAESLEIAESLTGYTCVEYTTEPAEPNGLYKNNTFVKAKPYSSWSLNETNLTWEAPVPKPEQEEGSYWKWDELNKNWIKVIIPNDYLVSTPTE